MESLGLLFSRNLYEHIMWCDWLGGGARSAGQMLFSKDGQWVTPSPGESFHSSIQCKCVGMGYGVQLSLQCHSRQTLCQIHSQLTWQERLSLLTFRLWLDWHWGIVCYSLFLDLIKYCYLYSAEDDISWTKNFSLGGYSRMGTTLENAGMRNRYYFSRAAERQRSHTEIVSHGDGGDVGGFRILSIQILSFLGRKGNLHKIFQS